MFTWCVVGYWLTNLTEHRPCFEHMETQTYSSPKQVVRVEGRKKMFCLTMYSTYFIYNYIAPGIL